MALMIALTAGMQQPGKMCFWMKPLFSLYSGYSWSAEVIVWTTYEEWRGMGGQTAPIERPDKQRTVAVTKKAEKLQLGLL